MTDYKDDSIWLMKGDCLERMKEIKSGSVDMVLTDPPYGTMNTDGGRRIGIGGWDIKLNTADMLSECNRILRPNGALVLFSQEPYTSELITNAHGCLPFSYRYTWLKDNFANHLGCKKAPVNYTEDISVFFKVFDSFLGHPLKPYMDAELEAACLTRAQAVTHWGSSASHYFTDGRQFMIPSRDKLAIMQKQTGRFQMPYEDMKSVNDGFRVETLRRFPKVFNLPVGAKYKSNVLEYRKDYGGHHPTQKPVALLADLVGTYTNEGDTVLDFTMGSGSTGVACANTGRKFIGIDMDDHYFEVAKGRILGDK